MMKARKVILAFAALALLGEMNAVSLQGAPPKAATRKTPPKKVFRDKSMTWDGDGVAPLGGSGIWSVRDARWQMGQSYRAWRWEFLRTAIFDTAAGTVTLGSDIVAHHLVFGVDGYYVTGKYPLILYKPEPTITVARRGDTATMNVSIEGDAGLRKAGGGALRLTCANHYTGETAVVGGTLILDGGRLPKDDSVLADTSVVISKAVVSLQGDHHRTVVRNGPFKVQSGILSADASKLANSFDLPSVFLTNGTLTGSHAPLPGYSHFLVRGVITSTGDGPSLVSAGLSDDRSDAPVVTFRVASVGRNPKTNLLVSGVIADCAAAKNKVSVRKLGTGTLAFSAANTYGGDTTVSNGTLLLDFDQPGAPASDIVKGSTSLTLNGGALAVCGKANAESRQTFDSVRLSRDASQIVVTSGVGGTVSLALGKIDRQMGGTLDFSLPASGVIHTTTRNAKPREGQPPLLGGYATVDGRTWATCDDKIAPGVIGGLTRYHEGFLADADVDVPLGRSTPKEMTVNSLRFNKAGEARVNASGPLTIASGGILVTSEVGKHATSIRADRLTSGNGQDLVILQNNRQKALIIASPMVGPMGVTKSGAGSLILTGRNTYEGDFVINGGLVRLDKPNTLGGKTAGIHLLAGTLDLNGQTVSSGKFLSVDDGAGWSRALLNKNPQKAASFAPSVIIATNKDLLTGGDGDLTLAGSIVSQKDSDRGKLVKTGRGALTLSGRNTFRGNTSIADGILRLANPEALAKSILDYSGKGTLAFGDLTKASLGGLTGKRDLPLSGSRGPVVLTVGGNNVDMIYKGVLSGPGSLTKIGAGRLTFRGATYGGATTIYAGLLDVDLSPAFNGSGKVFLHHTDTSVNKTSLRPRLIYRIHETESPYAGIGSTILGGDLHTRADIVHGAASGPANVQTWWTAPADIDKANHVIGGIFNLKGVREVGGGATDVFVLQMSYDPEMLQRDSGQSEAEAVAQRRLYLAVSTGTGWVPAVNANLGGTPHWQADSVPTSSLGTMLNDKLGWHGVDTKNHVVWAVVNGNNTFAVVVRPSGRHQDRQVNNNDTSVAVVHSAGRQDRNSGVMNNNDTSAAVARPAGRQDRRSDIVNGDNTSAAVVETDPTVQEPPSIHLWVAFAVGFVFLVLLSVLFYRYKKQKTSPKIR
ncbi:MAG: autotransporter-associated beta strand repeat-containing protein [Thermoguttaceae bacterium]